MTVEHHKALSIRRERTNQRILLALLILCLSFSKGVIRSLTAQAVLTQHNDNKRTGANLAETTLTPASVAGSNFGLLYSLPVDGTFGAQTLYVPGVIVSGVAHNILYVATRKNNLYAFDVGAPSLTPAQRLLWQVNLRDARGFGAEELPGMDGRFSGDTRPLCRQTHGPVGIASTPVIDAASSTMYVVYRTASPFGPAQYGTAPIYDAKFYLRKVDIRTGATLGENEIVVPGFDADKQLTRTGLLLQNGAVYLGFAGAVCDEGGGDPGKPAPHGWMVAMDAASLTLLAALNTTSNSSMGGIWQSGAGLAADDKGLIYALTGNNETDNANLNVATELNDAILQVQLNRSQQTLTQQHFTAGNWFRLDTGDRYLGDPQATVPCQPVFPCTGASAHVSGDSDLGSGGPVILTNGYVLGGGKQGRLYIIDPANMGVAKHSFQAFTNSWHPGISPCDYDEEQSFGPNIHGGLVSWRPAGAAYSLVYGMPEKDYLKAFRSFDAGAIDEHPFLSTMDSGIRSPRGMPGGSLSLSANGGQNGILWVSAVQQTSADAINTQGDFNGRLIAFDALSLNKLWESTDQVPFAKFIPPTVGGGKVFRPAYQDSVLVYGLGAAGSATGPPAISPTRTVTAVWRDSTHLSLFTTSRYLTGGSVLATDWQAVCPPPPASPGSAAPAPVTRGWRGWFPIDSQMDTVPDFSALPATYSFVASGAAPVTAVWRPGAPGQHLDLFATSSDGRVMSIAWQPPTQTLASGWQSWFPIGASSLSVVPGQPVTAVWKNLTHLDLFVTGKDGRIMSTYFDSGAWQPGWFPLNPATGTAAPGQPVTAVWRNAEHLDLFITSKTGQVMSTYFDTNAWQPSWFPLNPSTGTAAPGQPVTAVWRNANHLDLFITSNTGQVMTTYFDTNAWQPSWFALNPSTGAAAPGQPITAVWRNANHLDLFITSNTGQVLSTYFDTNTWQPSWFALNPSTGAAAPGQPVTAVWSNASHLDLFITGRDGRIMGTFFENNQWSPDGWFPI